MATPAAELSFERLTDAHLEKLRATICQEDAEKLVATGFSVDEGLRCAKASTVALAVLHGDTLLGIVGCNKSSVPGVADMWMVSSLEAKKRKRLFLAAGHMLTPAFLSLYSELRAMVGAQHPVVLRWLRAMGFEVGAATPYGPEGHLFHPVSIRRTPCPETP